MTEEANHDRFAAAVAVRLNVGATVMMREA
jgi:hypothetical protein